MLKTLAKVLFWAGKLILWAGCAFVALGALGLLLEKKEKRYPITWEFEEE